MTAPGNLPGGTYYLLVQTDTEDTQGESDESNNVLTQQIVLNTPDLRVVGVDAPAEGTYGQTLSVSWTVTNFGTGSTASGGWTDSVYLSADQMLGDGDISVGQAAAPSALAAGGSYVNSANITIPDNLTGYLSLIHI